MNTKTETTNAIQEYTRNIVIQLQILIATNDNIIRANLFNMPRHFPINDGIPSKVTALTHHITLATPRVITYNQRFFMEQNEVLRKHLQVYQNNLQYAGEKPKAPKSELV